MTIFIRIDYQTEWTAFLPLNPLLLLHKEPIGHRLLSFTGKKYPDMEEEDQGRREIEIKLLLSVSFTCGC